MPTEWLTLICLGEGGREEKEGGRERRERAWEGGTEKDGIGRERGRKREKYFSCHNVITLG